MKRLIAALFLAGATQTLGAQTVSGRVTDATSNPVARVEITVEGTQLAATTAEDGSYRLTQVPSGAHVIVARKALDATNRTPCPPLSP